MYMCKHVHVSVVCSVCLCECACAPVYSSPMAWCEGLNEGWVLRSLGAGRCTALSTGSSACGRWLKGRDAAGGDLQSDSHPSAPLDRVGI